MIVAITVILYVILTMILVLTIDTSGSNDDIVATNLDLLAALFSVLLLILLGLWSKYVAYKRDNLYKVTNAQPSLILSNEISSNQVLNKYKHQLILKVAQLIADVHQQGQYHGDISPNTILMDDYSVYDINADNKASDLLLTNLRLAEPIMLKTDNTSSQKAVNYNIVETIDNPAYQAPERWQAQSANQQSDIYAFGIIAYEILTGKPPFYIAETSVDPMLDWNNQHCLTPIPKLPIDYQSYQQIIDKALAKQRKKRYQTMQEVVIDLQSLTSC